VEPTVRGRKTLMWLLYLVLGAAILYAGLVAAIALTQTAMLFPTQLAAANRPPLPSSAVPLAMAASDGVRLVGVQLGPPDPAPDPRPLLLGFGGNAWNANAMALYLHGLFPDHRVVAFHYRGYRPSGGHPSAAALQADALAIFDHMQQEQQRPVIAIGFSIGSGVAAHLARHRPVDGLILVTPFDSLRELAREHFSWAPVALVLRHHMSPLEDLREVSVPVALIAGGHDTIVPAPRTEPLRHATRNLVLDQIIEPAGHNDLYDHPAFHGAMHAALARLKAAAEPQNKPP
jgi:pimeloyl-ACP methyl ester carboxylesterase